MHTETQTIGIRNVKETCDSIAGWISGYNTNPLSPQVHDTHVVNMQHVLFKNKYTYPGPRKYDKHHNDAYLIYQYKNKKHRVLKKIALN